MKNQIFFFRSLVILFAVTTMSAIAFAQAVDEEPVTYLDPPYHHIRMSPIRHSQDEFANPMVLPAYSDVESMIAHQTPIRNQSQRGTCAIFASTAMLESMLIINGKADTSIDLSEEWLEYLATYDRSGAEGSDSPNNFSRFATYGDANEATMPYIGEDWTQTQTPLSKERCPVVDGNQDKACLVAHFNSGFLGMSDSVLASQSDSKGAPEFAKAQDEAKQFKAQFLIGHLDTTGGFAVGPDQVKALLNSGIPVTVDIDFYYGAWNHREAVAYGLTRNMDYWRKGIVGYPEVGSLDRKVSQEHPDGHSVLIVGYDDDQVITETEQMQDGSNQTFTYKGVYFFKNAWGTDNFGPESMIRGQSHPGYGTITQKYTDDFGTYFRFPLSK